ncbi:glycosyltransferase [Streptomyces sp. NPDC058953]|uniref:glycosyltransferase n=1 Tax=Streptomyces sp. NPDC058953 TaxID=3346676 RepID=UPI0036AAB5C4
MKISFLIHSIYGIGGTIRGTLNLAEALAGRHEVEIVSVLRHHDIPPYTIGRGIALVDLVDVRPGSPGDESDDPAHREPSEAIPPREPRYGQYSKLTDERIRAHYAASDADVVIATRPALVPAVAPHAPQNAVLIGQEHKSLRQHTPELIAELAPRLDVLDALVTLTAADADAWREQLPDPDTRVVAVPHGVPEPTIAPADPTDPARRTIVAAAGRITREKQYDALLHAFARVVAAHPDWRLRLYGPGPDRERIRRVAHRLGLHNRVELMGSCAAMEPEWAKGSIAVNTSRHESFGIGVVEAMRCGLPVVATDCDHGPREILTDGENGLLAPVGDSGAVAAALLRLVGDEALRRRLAAAAVERARDFDSAVIAGRYEELFTALGAGPGHRAAPAPGVRPFAPVADCVAGADGSVTVRIVEPAAAAMKSRGLRLVCARAEPPEHASGGAGSGGAASGGPAPGGKKGRADRRGGRGGGSRARNGAPAAGSGEKVFPFAPDGTAVVPADAGLADGYWVCHADDPRTGRRVELTARTVDPRGTQDAAVRYAREAAVHHLVPFREPPAHRLAFRSWVRRQHVEAGDIAIDEHRLTLTGRILGTVEPAGEPTLVLRRGGDPDDELVFHGTREGTRGFSVVLDCETVADRREQEDESWELWLRYHPDHRPTAVGRLLDDVLRKSDVRGCPEVLLHEQRPLLLARRVLRKIRGQDQRLIVLRLAYDPLNRLVLELRNR